MRIYSFIPNYVSLSSGWRRGLVRSRPSDWGVAFSTGFGSCNYSGSMGFIRGRMCSRAWGSLLS